MAGPLGLGFISLLCLLGRFLVSEYWKRGVGHWQNLREGPRVGPVVDSGHLATSLPSAPFPRLPQAIAHYEQSADYYKGEESNRYGPRAPLSLSSPGPSKPQATTDLCLLRPPHTAQPTSVC